jgi:tetratricopeptide (TPR) repeat protein
VSFEAKLKQILAGPSDPDDLDELARLAIAAGEEERALPILRKAADQFALPRLWQWAGLLERALDDHSSALSSFAQAALLDPLDAGIAHGRARVALEAGLDSRPLFDRARQLAPANGEVLLGQAAARLAAGQGEEAAAELDHILAQVPLWLQGHAQLAQLRSILGRPDLAAASIERALSVVPTETALWHALFDLHLRREDFHALGEAVDRSRIAGNTETVLEHAAIAATETGEVDRAEALFQAARGSAQASLELWRVRHLPRTGRPDAASALIDRMIEGDAAASVWPYASLTWRLTSDERGRWLDGDSSLVDTIDLRPVLPDLDRLAALLRGLHVARGEFLDQSVRGGTQTDGPLFSRIDPEIRRLRSAVVDAVTGYVARMPQRDTEHPLLGFRRDRPIRFAGSWSVRLRGAGYHANHVHPQGWISSALYVSLPEPRGEEKSGWLTLGAPQATLGLDLSPTRLIEPRPGHLVLFPSWMWHGTRPFADGERLTVAFDVAPPR